MIAPASRLIVMLRLVEGIPTPDHPPRGRGRPPVYSDRLILKALVLMILRHLHHVHEFLAVVAEPTGEMEQVRALLTEQGRFPCRRTWERRLARIPDRLPGQIAWVGRCLVVVPTRVGVNRRSEPKLAPLLSSSPRAWG